MTGSVGKKLDTLTLDMASINHKLDVILTLMADPSILLDVKKGGEVG